MQAFASKLFSNEKALYSNIKPEAKVAASSIQHNKRTLEQGSVSRTNLKSRKDH